MRSSDVPPPTTHHLRYAPYLEYRKKAPSTEPLSCSERERVRRGGRGALAETHPSAGVHVVVVQDDLRHFKQNGVRKRVLLPHHPQVNFSLRV